MVSTSSRNRNLRFKFLYRLLILAWRIVASEYLYLMLRMQNIVKSYGKQVVLRIQSFHIDNGIHWIKGANGSGKTTLLKMIAGLLPFEGDISVNNISIKKQPLVYRQQISWSEAEPLYPSFLRGMDLVKLYCNIRKASQKEADALVSVLKMDEYISDATCTYSAGMTKKLSLLLSFLGKPSLIILDEPLITLDAETVDTISRLFMKMNEENETGFIISSHQDIDEQALRFDKSFIISSNTILAG